MTRTVQPPEVLKVIEDGLVRHPAFGDSAYIQEQFCAASERRIAVLASHRPSAGRLGSALCRASDRERLHVLRHTVVRSAIQHAHVQVETGRGYGFPEVTCDSIFDEAASWLASEAREIKPFPVSVERLPRLTDGDWHGFVWSEAYPADVFGLSFRRLVEDNWHGALSALSDDELTNLRRGATLLFELVPLLAQSALSHVHVVGVFDNGGGWRNIASSSQFRVGGAIFLSRNLVRSGPWTIAEHLLHESLHHKLYDFRHGHTLLTPESGALRTVSPWNPDQLSGANLWDTHRVFAAFHVYVQLTVLSQMATHRRDELEAEYGPVGGLVESHTALERAWYLGRQLHEHCWNELGLAGRRMVEWLTSILDALDPQPPPDAADLHLVLDLYLREARGIAARLEAEALAPNVLDRIGRIAVKEFANAGRILADVSPDQSRAFETYVDEFRHADLGPLFLRVREGVVAHLLQASLNGYAMRSLTGSGDDPNERVRAMVLASSQALHAALENLPDAVAAAMVRANQLGFRTSCLDDVGRLLAVVAAAVPPNGRVLEVGTGVGVGLGWITSGLGERTDVEVISIEIDQRLSESATEWPWSPNVQIETRDALDGLQQLGRFDLVFVDASPVKHGYINRVIDALRPRGTLVVDDVRVTDSDADQLDLQAKLRRSLLHHPNLRAVELDWSSGVILATRTDPD